MDSHGQMPQYPDPSGREPGDQPAAPPAASVEGHSGQADSPAPSGWQGAGQQNLPPQASPRLLYGPPVAGAVLVEGTFWVPAGFGPRFFAFILDWALLGILHSILVIAVGVPRLDDAQAITLLTKLAEALASASYPSDSLLRQLDQLMLPANFSSGLMIAMCAAYYIIFHGMLGATAGKLVLGLRVLRRDGQPINAAIAALRYVIYYLTGWLAYTGWLTWFNAEKRTVHDMVAGTNVFRSVGSG